MPDKTITTEIRHQTVCPLCEGNVIYIEALEAFRKEMIKKTIPEIVKAVRMRQQLAAEYRGPLDRYDIEEIP